MKIYWIDVEGGASTLFVSPTGESLLFDTGYEVGDRDAKRIFATAHAGRIAADRSCRDQPLAWRPRGWSGGALAKLIPLGKFYDHGDGVEPEDLWQGFRRAMKKVAGAKRTIVKPGRYDPLQRASRFRWYPRKGR